MSGWGERDLKCVIWAAIDWSSFLKESSAMTLPPSLTKDSEKYLLKSRSAATVTSVRMYALFHPLL
jgi:hypothetical protein